MYSEQKVLKALGEGKLLLEWCASALEDFMVCGAGYQSVCLLWKCSLYCSPSP